MSRRQPLNRYLLMLGLKKILLPVDFSDRAEGSARYAQAIASCFCSHITLLLHVEHDPFLVRSEELKGPLVVGRCPSSGRLHSETYTIIRQSPCAVVSV